MRCTLITLAAFMTLSSASTLGAEGDAEAGRFFVEEHCAACHAVSHEDESPHASAPALRTLHHNYPVAFLAEAFAEGIMVGHPDMPQFQFHPETIDNLIAYLESLEGHKDLE